MKTLPPIRRPLTVTSRGPSETRELGRRLARFLKKGDVIVLVADLGAGKTTLVQGIAKGLGVDEEALSPTFVLVQTLAGRLPVHHMDFYRLRKNEILGIGIVDYLRGAGEIAPGVVLIEWADRCRDIWPPDRLEIRLSIGRSKERRIALRGMGARGGAIVDAMRRRS